MNPKAQAQQHHFMATVYTLYNFGPSQKKDAQKRGEISAPGSKMVVLLRQLEISEI